MTADLHFYEPRLGHGLKHDPFNSIVGPRSIGWISSRSAAGHLNLAPYSFFNAFNYVPPLLGFASIGAKDTLRNVQETGEFVWNLVTHELAQAMNETCIDAPPEIDEFALARLTPVECHKVKVPRVGESPVAFECKLTQILQLQGHDGQAVDTWMIFGEVVGVHIERRLIVDGVYDTAAADPILRGGGFGDYFRIDNSSRFQMRRPQWETAVELRQRLGSAQD